MLPLLLAISLAAVTDENLRVLAAIEQGRLDMTLEIPTSLQSIVFVFGSPLNITRPAAEAEDCQPSGDRQTDREREIYKQRSGRDEV